MCRLLGKLLPAGALIKSRLTCRVLDYSFKNIICDCLDISYFKNLFHKFFSWSYREKWSAEPLHYWTLLLCLFVLLFYLSFKIEQEKTICKIKLLELMILLFSFPHSWKSPNQPYFVKLKKTFHFRNIFFSFYN